MDNWTNYIPVVLCVAATISLIWTDQWRYNIIAIAIQYLVVFWFVMQFWPIGLAAIKLITGWMAAAVLGASVTANVLPIRESPVMSSKLFRVVVGAIVLILGFSIAPRAAEWLPVSIPALTASLILVGMGLLNLSMTTDPLKVIIGLLTLLSGFEIVYAAVVNSVLVTGLLALVTMGIALTGAYWLSLGSSEETG
jgi:hypothetical protein